MPHYTHKINYKDQIYLVPATILVEGLNGYFIEETFEEFHGAYTRRRLVSHDAVYECEAGGEKQLLDEVRKGLHGVWQVGDYVYIPSKDLYGFVTNVNRVMLTVDNPEIKKTHKVRKGNLLLISRIEQITSRGV